MNIKFSNEIIKEIQRRGNIEAPEGYVTGESYEEWLLTEERSVNMGRYLIVDGKENNTKIISYSMINLFREIFPEKKSLSGEDVFAFTQKEVAAILNNSTQLIKDDELLKQYIDKHSDDYGINDKKFEDIRETFIWIQICFSEILSNMVFYDRSAICCEWE